MRTVRTKHVQQLRVGDYLFHNSEWKRIERVKELITTCMVYLEGDEALELGLELTVRYRTKAEQQEVLAEEGLVLPRESEVEDIFDKELREEGEIRSRLPKRRKKSSQKGTENGKNGLRPSKTDWLIGVVLGFVVSGNVLWLGKSIGLSSGFRLAIGLVVWGGVALFAADLLRDIRQKEDLLAQYKAELRERNSEVRMLSQTSMNKGVDDFITGMNQAGVEIALGGASPFGQTASIKLRFPVVTLHKHIVNGMVNGYETGVRIGENGPSDEFVRRGFEEISWKWIEQMTEGKR